mgnify:CR=1 FL=1
MRVIVHVIQTETHDHYTISIRNCIYKFDTVLIFKTVIYQLLETGTSDITFMGRDQELK